MQSQQEPQELESELGETGDCFEHRSCGDEPYWGRDLRSPQNLESYLGRLPGPFGRRLALSGVWIDTIVFRLYLENFLERLPGLFRKQIIQ